ncbi:RidA family protein [Roseomonas sp. BN140053]|uniref:RidA family protein n=1 Tax=Roseomonas sp. BN140053 TaxID=3391898 RepID=UPI0039E93B87
MATITLSNPAGVHPPSAAYSHAAVIEGGAKRLLISAQVGVAPDGRVSSNADEQIDQVFRNLGAVLSGHGLAPRHIAKITAFLTDRLLIGPWRRKRDQWFEGHEAAATLLLVAGLADRRFVVEVEAEAVFPD